MRDAVKVAQEFIEQSGVDFVEIDTKDGVVDLNQFLADFIEFTHGAVVMPPPLDEKAIMELVKEWDKTSGLLIYKAPPQRETSYLLFGKEVCHAMEEGIDEVLALIEDGAEYGVMETDGSNLPSVMERIEEYDGWSFLTKDEYLKILNHD